MPQHDRAVAGKAEPRADLRRGLGSAVSRRTPSPRVGRIAGVLIVAVLVGLGLALRRPSEGPPEHLDRSNPPAPIDLTWPTQARPETGQVALGRAIYDRECASCHGANAEGQPNWTQALPDGSLPAPPHDASGHTWHHSDAELIRIILMGGTVYDPNSNMPAFAEKVTVEEAKAILAYIRTYWGPRERSYQAEQTRRWETIREQVMPTPTVVDP